MAEPASPFPESPTPPNAPMPIASAREVAILCNVHPSRIHRLIECGDLTPDVSMGPNGPYGFKRERIGQIRVMVMMSPIQLAPPGLLGTVLNAR
jgi:hypothetical protein